MVTTMSGSPQAGSTKIISISLPANEYFCEDFLKSTPSDFEKSCEQTGPREKAKFRKYNMFFASLWDNSVE